MLWVVRDTLVAQPFNAASNELTGSLVSVSGTENVSSFGGTSRANVTVSNDGTLLYSAGGSRYQLAWFKPDGTALGTVGATDQYIGLRLSPDGGEAMVTIRDPAATGRSLASRSCAGISKPDHLREPRLVCRVVARRAADSVLLSGWDQPADCKRQRSKPDAKSKDIRPPGVHQ